MRSEQRRQAELFQRREEMTWQAHRLSREAPDPELRERLENYRTKILRDLIDRSHPDKSQAWREARLRELLGQPIPVKSKTTPKSCKAPARSKTDSAAGWKRAKRLYDAANAKLLTKSIRQRYQVEGLQVR
ncbi:MAG: hypothetical protein IJM76_07275 [Lachnospiraceae bacterium]|nr:hypothetical protein [Lachnospiraceae bacterium]